MRKSSENRGDTRRRCPNCLRGEMSVFYRVENVPVNSVILLYDYEEATKIQRGNIVLGVCEECGFISNTEFYQELTEYSARYEGTQAFSPTYNEFQQKLAKMLIRKFDLHQKRILEIGCGQGDFLMILCEHGNNIGVGYDPAYRGETKRGNIELIPDFYSEKYAPINADFICCKMTLEHVYYTNAFMSMLRNSIQDNRDTIVFFQVPNTTKILREAAFWDIYYEHSSYFTPESLWNLFYLSGFNIVDVWSDYMDQYLMIAARPSEIDQRRLVNSLVNPTDLIESVRQFKKGVKRGLNGWRERLKRCGGKKRRGIWGSGSKGVAFLTTLGVKEEIDFCVDINLKKEGTYMPGTGHKIVSPGFLREIDPDLIIMMNPIYHDEIQRELEDLGIISKLISVTEGPGEIA